MEKNHQKKNTKKNKKNTNNDKIINAMEWLENEFGPLTFGAALKAQRQCEKVSQKELGDRIGASKQYISQIESDRRSVSIAQAGRLAEALGYEPEMLTAVLVEEKKRKARIKNKF